MGTTTDKLNRLKETKTEIASAIQEKGVPVEQQDTFYSYGDKIRAIKTGASDAKDVNYDNISSQLKATNVQTAIDEVNQKVHNNEIVQIITETEYEQLLQNGQVDPNKLYYIQGSGDGTLSTTALTTEYDNQKSQLSSVNVQDAIDEINIKIYNNEIVQIITEEEYARLLETGAVDPNKLYYIQGSGDGTLSTTALTTDYDNQKSELISINVQDAIDEINTKVYNNEIVQIITEEEYSHLLETGTLDENKLYYIEGSGDGTLSTTAKTTEYDNKISGLQAINVQDAVDEINNRLTNEEWIKLKALLGKLIINTNDISFTTEVKADSFDALK